MRESKSLRSEVFDVTDIVNSCEYDSLFAFQMELGFFPAVVVVEETDTEGKKSYTHRNTDDTIVELDGIDDHRSVICTNVVIGIGNHVYRTTTAMARMTKGRRNQLRKKNRNSFFSH